MLVKIALIPTQGPDSPYIKCKEQSLFQGVLGVGLRSGWKMLLQSKGHPAGKVALPEPHERFQHLSFRCFWCDEQTLVVLLWDLVGILMGCGACCKCQLHNKPSLPEPAYGVERLQPKQTPLTATGHAFCFPKYFHTDVPRTSLWLPPAWGE